MLPNIASIAFKYLSWVTPWNIILHSIFHALTISFACSILHERTSSVWRKARILCRWLIQNNNTVNVFVDLNYFFTEISDLMTIFDDLTESIRCTFYINKLHDFLIASKLYWFRCIPIYIYIYIGKGNPCLISEIINQIAVWREPTKIKKRVKMEKNL